ncbi:MAG: signal recognition particle protein [Actinobacteria bacterium]|jgi:signal recognition particle subunit SRP54|nr:signal recognition particle protein [Actinomycetota bacterium]MEA2503613.1 signal recognition particle subunit [Actinomycetota bacterium]MEA2567974.1 signal recognition particle subunit [Actinomycetota bacterium]
MFDTLGNRLDDIFRKLRSRGRLTEKEIDEALREIRVALLEADVALPAVRTFLQHVKAEALGEDVLKSLTPGQQVIKIVHEELVRMLGGQSAGLVTASKPPTVIMLAGLQGSGKTSTAGKLAALLRRKGQRPLLVAADLQRPAAIRQLQILGEQAKVAVHAEMGETDPVAVVRRALEEGRRDADVVILDTAGRLHVDPEMMDQVARVHAVAQPDEVLFVLDAMTGQDALVSAKAFAETIPLTGIIITKLDGDARGGAALSAATVTGRPIKFAGMGEKLGDLEPFHPDRIASRILGMGDVLTLIEKAEATVSKEEAEKQARKILDAAFTLEDFLSQMQQVRKMGGIGSLVKMLPGLPGMGRLSDLAIEDKDMVKLEAIIRSMTPVERNDPRIISGSRRARIARGSGTQVRDVNELLKQFDAVRKMMKSMTKGGGKKGRRGAFSLPPGLGL